jgi:hypothetical protein
MFYEGKFLHLDPPVISLELGSKLQAGDIKEGDDVYFECRIESNPKFRKLTWLHNVSALASAIEADKKKRLL